MFGVSSQIEGDDELIDAGILAGGQYEEYSQRSACELAEFSLECQSIAERLTTTTEQLPLGLDVD